MKCSKCKEGGGYQEVMGKKALVCPFAPRDSAYILDRKDDKCIIPKDLRVAAHRELKRVLSGQGGE